VAFTFHPPFTTVGYFIVWCLRPENSELILEFIDGELIEKMQGSSENSAIAFYLGHIVQS